MMRESRWVGRSVALWKLADLVQTFMLDDKFTEIVRYGDSRVSTWQEVRGDKTGVLRTICGSRKSMHVIIRGQPDDFTISIDTGEWGKNAIAALLTCGLGLAGITSNVRLARRLQKHVLLGVKELEGSSADAAASDADFVHAPMRHVVSVRHGRRVVSESHDVDCCSSTASRKKGRGGKPAAGRIREAPEAAAATA